MMHSPYFEKDYCVFGNMTLEEWCPCTVVLWGARNEKIELKRNVSVTMVRKYGRSPLS